MTMAGSRPAGSDRPGYGRREGSQADTSRRPAGPRSASPPCPPDAHAAAGG